MKQDETTYTHGKIANIYLVYEIVGGYSGDDNYPTLEITLFGAVKLTKNADIDEYWYSDYGIGFDRRSGFSFSDGRFGQNVIIFKVDNRKKDILILGKGLT